MAQAAHQSAVVGVAWDGDKAAVVRLHRQHGQVIARWEQTATAQLPTVVARLRQEVPVAVAMPDSQVLHQRLALPDTDDATLDRMVQAQMQSLLPGRDVPLRTGWQRQGDRSEVTAIAARADVARSAAEASGDASAVLVPVGVAFTALAAGSLPHSAGFVVAASASSTSVVRLEAGRAFRIVVLDVAADDAPQAWADQVQSAMQSMGDAGPVRVYGRKDAESLLTARTAAPVEAVSSEWLQLSARSDAEYVVFTAAGAGLALLDGAGPLLRPVEEEAAAPASWSRLHMMFAAAASWLMLAVLLLAVSDFAQARWQATARRELAPDTGALKELDRQLAMLRYLDSRGPTPLAVVDEIAGLTPKDVQLGSLNLSREGGLVIAGEIGNEQKLSELLGALSNANTLDAVELRSQKKSGNKVEYEITSRPSRRFTLAYVEPADRREEEPEGAVAPDRKERRP